MAVSNALRDFTKCTICLSSFTKPRMLNCLHTFCLPCLEKLVEEKEENTNIKCPLCRSEFMLPMDGLSGLKSPDFFLKDSSYLRKEDIPLAVCQICDSSRVAFVKCVDCNEYMCKECQKCHGKFKATKGHELEYLQTHVNDIDNYINEQCEKHSKDLTLFCRPCNNSVCTECQKAYHKKHDVIALCDAATKERNILFAGIRGLKSKILPIIESTLDDAKAEQYKFSKHCNRIKQEMRDHATGLKEVFVRHIDLALNANIEELEKLKKVEIKNTEAYIDSLETDKLSYASLLQNSEFIVNGCTDRQIVKESTNLRLRLDEMTKYESTKLDVHQFEYESGEISEQEIINIFGRLKLILKSTLTPSFRQLAIPDLRLMKKITIVESLDIEKGVNSIVGGPDSNACILDDRGMICLYSSNGVIEKYYGNDTDRIASRLLKTRDGTIYVWGVNSATKLGDKTAEDFYKVPFDNGVVGCFLANHNLIVYNPDEKTLYEVNGAGDIQRKNKNERLSNILNKWPINMIETNDKNLIIVTTNRVITIRPDGIIQNVIGYLFNTYSYLNICTDNYGNVFLISRSGSKQKPVCEILLRSTNGLKFSSIHTFKKANKFPKHAVVDGHGNLWCCAEENEITIYSYM